MIAEMVERRRQGKTWREIAVFAGLPVSTVRNQVKAAMEASGEPRESLMSRREVAEKVQAVQIAFAQLHGAVAVGSMAKALLWVEEVGEVLRELQEHVGL